MKKLIAGSALALFSTGLYAQQNMVKAGFYLGNSGLQYERALGERISLVGQIGYSSIPTRVGSNDSKSTGIGYYAEARYYLSKRDGLMRGFHLGPYYTFLNVDDKNEGDLNTNLSSIGAVGGYQHIFGNGIVLGASLGLGTLRVESDVKLDIGGIDFFPNLGITIGYQF
ncbi:MAG: DUF3575 domain-containing protein [Muricauda sp.]|nr:DUF3575 domain-containing protein [Allomuricauda sp.]MBA4745987.1 DUF3575 domain-containing protein [Allomuricauda sp.]